MHDMDNCSDLEELRDELNHFIRLSQVQAEQLERYQQLQQRSHSIIQKLQSQIKKDQSNQTVRFKK